MLKLKCNFYNLAVLSAKIAGNPIKPFWVYTQMAHETNNFTSTLCTVHHNLAGLTQLIPNDLPQPDGDLYYMQFNSYKDCARYFGHYLKLYSCDGIYQATDLESYVTALKNGGYFGDSIENYLGGMKHYEKQIQTLF